MNTLRLSENILSLRRKRGITQDDLASFLGVTKASVSKWETRQSYPDILLLPQIAAYFNITIDELIGYEPQLSPEQMKKYYIDLAEEFSTQSFEKTMGKRQSLVKEYYACYEFLLQMVKLWMNHFMLTPDTNRQIEILNEAIGLCDHIGDNSQNMELCSMSLMLKSTINLQLGRAQEAIEILEPLADPKHLMYQKEDILIQAYQMAVFYSTHQKKEEAMKALQAFVDGGIAFVQSGIRLHGDEYFDRIEEWFGTFELDVTAPRTEKVVLESLEPAIQSPVLAVLFDMEEYKKLQKKLKRAIQNYVKGK